MPKSKIEDNAIRIEGDNVIKGNIAIGKDAKVTINKNSKEEGVSMIDLANLAIKKIVLLGKSEKLSHKLAAFNLILFLIALGLNLSYWIFGWQKDNFMLIVSLSISLIFSAIITLIYLQLIIVLLGIITKKISGFRASISVLMFALTSSLVGTLFKKEIFFTISGVLLLVQALALLLFEYLNLSKTQIEDKPVKQIIFWQWLGNVANLITICNFLIWVILFIIKLAK